MKKHLQPLRLFLALFLMFCAMKSYAQTDVTSTYLTNANFSAGNTTGWTNKFYDFTNATNNNVTEYYKAIASNISSTFSLNQKISTLPEGVYRITVNGFNRAPSTVTNIIFFGETSNKQYQVNLKTLASETTAYGSTPNSTSTASAAFYSTAQAGGFWKNTIDNIIVEDGKLNIGVTNIGQLQLASGNSWTCFTNFKIYSLTGTELQPLLNSIISEAQTLAALNYSNVSNLNNAISTAQGVSASSIVYNDIKTLQNAIDSYKNSSLNNATISSPVDATFKIKNASFENGATHMLLNQIGGQTGTDFALSGGGGYFSPNGWITTIAAAAIGNGNTWDGAAVCNNGVIPIAGSGTITPSNGSLYFGSRKRWNSGVITLSQQVSSLPVGKYKIAVDLGTATGTPLTGTFTSKVNGTTVLTASPSTNAFTTFTSNQFSIVSGENLDLSFTMGNNSTNSDHRIIMDNVVLTYYGPPTEPVVSAPTTSASFTTTTNTTTIDITGANLTSDITISAPSANITLSGTNVTGTSPNYTIALANANTTNSITATWSKTANVSGNITFTSGDATKSVAVTTSDVETVSISGFNITSGILNPTFDVNTTTYSIKTPVSGTTITATKTPVDATVSNSGTTLSSSNTSIVMTGSSYNGGASTSSYTFNWDGNYAFDDWDANGDVSSTAVSLPSTYGWQCINTTDNTAENVWNNFGTQSNCRYRDTNSGYTYNGADKSNVRIMFIRWDAGGTTNRVFSYPVYLETGTNYQINGKIAWNSNGSAPIVNFKINSAANNGGTNYATSNITTGSSGALKDINLRNISVPTTGVYYFTISANTASLCAISDLQLNTQDSFTADGDNTWSTKSWTQGRAPKSGDNLTVSNGTLVIDDFINLNTITIAPGAKITINTGKSVDALTVNIQSNENGTGTILNNGNTTITNANIQQYLTTKSAVDKTDNWWYISSPVSNATSAVILTEGSGNKFGYYNEATATYPQITATDAALTAGKGYVAQINTTGTYTFSGTLNNGDVPVTLTRTGNTHLKRGFNLVGNPYLSFLNWNDVKGARTDIRSTVWFRTRTAAGAMTFDTYNGLTGTNLGKNGEVTQHIPPMQAFWVKVHEDATSGDPLVNTINLTLTNTMRSHQDQTLTTNRLRAPEADDKQIIRINVSNGTNKDEAILMSYAGAQDLMDTYDSEKISNNNVSIPEIYTLLNNEEITINTMNSLPLNIEMPLGFRTGQAGNFTISTSELTNLGSDVKLILKDKMTSTETEMTVDNAYSFASDAVNTNDRFTVMLKATGVTTDVHQLKNALLVYGNTNNQIVVSGLIAEGTPVHIFNAVGQQIYQGELNGSYNVISQKLQQGVYIIKINQTIQKVTLK